MDINVNVTGEEKVAKLTSEVEKYVKANEALTERLGKQYLHTQNIEAAYKALTLKTAGLEAETVNLSKALANQVGSFAAIAGAGEDLTLQLNSLYKANEKLIASTTSLLKAETASEAGMKASGLVTMSTAKELEGLNSVMAKQASLLGQSALLNNEAYVAEEKRNISLASGIAARKQQIFYEEKMAAAQAAYAAESMKGTAAAEKLLNIQTMGVAQSKMLKDSMLERAAAQAAYNAEAMRGVAAAEKLIGVQTVGARATSLLKEQMLETAAAEKAAAKASLSAAGAAEKQTAATRQLAGANEALVVTQKNAHAAIRGTAGAMGGLWLSYGNILPMVIAFGAASTVKGIMELGSAFEYLTKYAYQLSDATVPLGSMREQLLAMKDLAQTPNELAAGLLELTKAGLSASDGLRELPTVSKYAAIAEQDLDKSTKQLVTITSAFEKTSKGAAGGMLTLKDTADIVAAAAQGSVASFEEMQTALKYVTALSSTAEISLQEVSAALMVMHDAGLTGSMGATALRTALTKIIDPSSKARKILDEAGVSMEKFASGNKIKSLSGMFKELNRLHDLMTAEDWKKFSFAAFGLRGELIEAVLTNTKKFEENLTMLGNSAGFVDNAFAALSETTSVMAKNLQADFQRALVTAFDGEKAREILTDLRDIVNSPNFISGLENIASGAYKVGKAVASMVGEFAELPGVLQVATASLVLFGGVWGKVAAGILWSAKQTGEAIQQLKINPGEAMTGMDLSGMSGSKVPELISEYDKLNNRLKSLKAKYVEYSAAQKWLADNGYKIPEESIKKVEEYRTAIAGLTKQLDALKQASKTIADVNAAKGDNFKGVYSQGMLPKAGSTLTAKDEPHDLLTPDNSEKILTQTKALHRLQLQSNAEYYKEVVEQAKLATKDHMASLQEEEDAIHAAFAVKKNDLKDWYDDTLKTNVELIKSDASVKAQFEKMYDTKLASLRISEFNEITKADDAYLQHSLNNVKKRVAEKDKIEREARKRQAASDKFDTAMDKMLLAGTGGVSKYDKAVQHLNLSMEEHLNALEKVHGKGTAVYEEKVRQAEEVKRILMENDPEILRSQDSVIKGLKAGYLDLKSSAQTLGEATSDAFTGAFDRMTDGLANFVVTGKMNFKSFAASVIADIARIYAKQLATGLFLNIAGSIFGGGDPGGAAAAASSTNLFQGTATPAILNAYVQHGGGTYGVDPIPARAVPAALFDNAPRHHNGLKGDEYPAILEKGETVIPKGMSTKPAGNVYHINVKVDKGAGGSDEDKQALADKMAKSIKAQIRDIMAEEKRYGGVLYAGRG